MKTEFLQELGLEQDAIDKIMAENGKDVEAQKAKTTSMAADRDSLKAQLDDVAVKLKAFEGVDVDSLKGEIDTLKTSLADKEAEYNTQLADRDFTATLNAEILAAKGKNPMAIMALLDTEVLKASKNQKDDIAAAIKGLSESDAYLFGDAENTNTTLMSTGGEHTEPSSTEADAFVAAAMKGAGLSTGKEG